jgi:excisionase family DNA binding protein
MVAAHHGLVKPFPNGGGQMNDKMLLTVDEAAQRLSVGRSLLYERLLRGELLSVKVGRRRLVPGAALDEFVKRLRQAEE